jgi:hypothetical protein
MPLLSVNQDTSRAATLEYVLFGIPDQRAQLRLHLPHENAGEIKNYKRAKYSSS